MQQLWQSHVSKPSQARVTNLVATKVDFDDQKRQKDHSTIIIIFLGNLWITTIVMHVSVYTQSEINNIVHKQENIMY